MTTTKTPTRKVELEFDPQEFTLDRVPLSRLVRSIRDRLDDIWRRITYPNPGEDAVRRSWMEL